MGSKKELAVGELVKQLIYGATSIEWKKVDGKWITVKRQIDIEALRPVVQDPETGKVQAAGILT